MMNSVAVTISKGLDRTYKYMRMPVRVISFENKPWWALVDVCQILGLSNPSRVAQRLDDDEKMTLTLSEGHAGQRGGAQSMIVVNEPGLYEVIIRSDKPEAKKFRRWITHDVIPSIRQKGFYGQLTRTEAMEMCFKHKISVEEYCEYRTGKDFEDYAISKVRVLRLAAPKKQDYGAYTYTIESLAEEMGLHKDVLVGAMYESKLNKRKDCCKWFDDCGWRFSWFGRYLLDNALPREVKRNTLY